MTTFTDEIRATVSPHKFGGDRMAAALWLLSLAQGQDDQTGSAVDWSLWCARFGRRLLYVTSSGAVSQERFVDENAARLVLNEVDIEYGEALGLGEW